MKKKIIELLATKFEGVDDSILARIAETKAAKAIKTEEEAETFVEGITLAKLLNTYGDSRATESQKTAIANYEKQHGLKDGKKVMDGGNLKEPEKNETIEGEGGEATPAWAKDLMESNKKLAARLEAMEGEKKATTRKQKLQETIGKLPESIRKGYERTSINDLSEEEFDELMTTIGSEVEEIIKENKVSGATFTTPQMRHQGDDGGKGKEASKDEVDAVMSKL